MNEEIKEILDIERYKNKDGYVENINLLPDEIHKLLDYITNLQQKYNKALETLVEYSIPCEKDDFNLSNTDYCSENCSNNDEQFKKCWNEFIEWRIKDER